METLTHEVRSLVYIMICFQCLLELVSGSTYQKYLKLLAYLIIIYICCNIFASFIGQLEYIWKQADKQYEEWENKTDGIADMEENGDYLERCIMDRIRQEYDSTEEVQTP